MKMEAKLDEATRVELERLELLLMDSEVRRDRQRFGALLTSDFVEFGHGREKRHWGCWRMRRTRLRKRRISLFDC